MRNLHDIKVEKPNIFGYLKGATLEDLTAAFKNLSISLNTTTTTVTRNVENVWKYVPDEREYKWWTDYVPKDDDD